MEVVEEIKAEAQKVEAAVEHVVTGAEKEAEKVVATAEGEVKAAVAEAKKFATEARIEVTDAEKLVLMRMENEFLKAQMELRRLQELAKNIQESFPKQVEALQKKYFIDPATHLYDAIQGAFVKKQS